MGVLTLTVVGSVRNDMTVELLISEHEDVVSEGNPVVLHNSCQLSSKQPRALVQIRFIFLYTNNNIVERNHGDRKTTLRLYCKYPFWGHPR